MHVVQRLLLQSLSEQDKAIRAALKQLQQIRQLQASFKVQDRCLPPHRALQPCSLLQKGCDTPQQLCADSSNWAPLTVIDPYHLDTTVP